MTESLSSEAPSSTQRLTAAGSCPGCRSRQRAAVPATWGEAIEVPLSVVEPPKRRADVMSTPGAKTATHSPVFVKEAPRSLRSEAPAADRLQHPGGRRVAGVRRLVARGDRVAHAARDRAAHGEVERRRRRAAQAHVGDGRPAVLLHVLGHPVDSPDHVRVGAAAVLQHAHGVQGHGLGDAELGPADRACDVRPVALVVGRIARVGREPLAQPARELGVARCRCRCR